MKAWELQDRGFDNLRLVERPTPQPGPHDLLVRVSAVSLNHRDEDIILGDYFPQQPQLSYTPLIIVSDAAGIVAEAGVEVSRFKEGDRVTTHLLPMDRRRTARSPAASPNTWWYTKTPPSPRPPPSAMPRRPRFRSPH